MVLFVCSLGRNRSRSAELLCLLGGMDARSCGTDAGAFVAATDTLIREASYVFCMENHHKDGLVDFQHYGLCPIVTLGIPDIFDRLDPKLVRLLISSVEFYSHEVADAMQRGADLLLSLPGSKNGLEEGLNSFAETLIG